MVANSGTQMLTFGIGWFVVQLAVRDGVPERGALYLALIGLARGVSSLLFGLAAGPLADRADRRRLLIATQAAAGAMAAVVATLVLTERAALPTLMACMLVTAGAQSFDSAARFAMVPRLVPPASFASAVGLNLMAMNVATLLGPLAGGLLIGRLGAGGMLLVDTLLWLPILGALLAMRSVPTGSAPARASLLASAREGFGGSRQHIADIQSAFTSLTRGQECRAA